MPLLAFSQVLFVAEVTSTPSGLRVVLGLACSGAINGGREGGWVQVLVAGLALPLLAPLVLRCGCMHCSTVAAT